MINKVYKMKPAISAIIYSHNDQEKISSCISSLQRLTKEIHLINIESTDNTVNIASKFNVKIYNAKKVRYVELVREEGIRQANSQWIFLLDADETISEKLSDEINDAISTTNKTHFFIPRKNLFAGKKWLRFGGWWPDNQIRLIKLEAFVKWPKIIHSTPIINGNFGYLKNAIIHSFHGDLEQMVKKTIKFEDIESDLLYRAGKNVKTSTFFRKFLGELYRRNIKNLGFLDGSIGIIEGIYQAFSKTITYLFLYEKRKNRPIRSIS